MDISIYLHTPGIHTNAKLIYADYAMVYKKLKQKPKPNKQTNKTTTTKY